jgi:hypothetical protein
MDQIGTIPGFERPDRGNSFSIPDSHSRHNAMAARRMLDFNRQPFSGLDQT